MEQYDVIIVGGGPAGLTAGLYTSRMELKTALFEKQLCGGQMNNTDTIENYMGYESIKGYELSQIMESHTKKFGTDIVKDEVIEISKNNDEFVVKTRSDRLLTSKGVIIASGAIPAKLNVLGEDKFLGKGVSYCAICDAAFFRNEDVAVIGGGNAAVEEAVFLTKYVNKVYLIHRRNELRASKYYQNRLFQNKKVEVIWDSIITEIIGESNVKEIVVKNLKDNKISRINLGGVFVFIGYSPVKNFFSNSTTFDEQGFYVTDSNCMTKIDGLFVIGDARSKIARQISSAVGDGTVAAIALHKYLSDKESSFK